LKEVLPDKEGSSHPTYGLMVLVCLFVVFCLMAILGASIQGPLTFESFWPLAVMGYVGAIASYETVKDAGKALTNL